MEITQKALEEFKKIYKKEFGEDLSDDEALEIAQRVLGFFSLIYRPLPNQEKSPKFDNGNFDNLAPIDYDEKELNHA